MTMYAQTKQAATAISTGHLALSQPSTDRAATVHPISLTITTTVAPCPQQRLSQLKESMERIEMHVTNWLAAHSAVLLRVSLGVIFLWFGFLKFFPGMSPAEDLVGRTILAMSFGMVHPNISLPVLATWETVIGIGMISGISMRAVLLLLFMQMVGTVMPLFLFPHETFTHAPYAPTLEGQYIIKNLVLVTAALALWPMVCGNRVLKQAGMSSRTLTFNASHHKG